MKALEDGKVSIIIPRFCYVSTFEEVLENFRGFYGVGVIAIPDLFWKKKTNERWNAMFFHRHKDYRLWQLARLNKVRCKTPKALKTPYPNSAIILN